MKINNRYILKTLNLTCQFTTQKQDEKYYHISLHCYNGFVKTAEILNKHAKNFKEYTILKK